MRVESAPMRPDNYIKLLWLKDAQSGEVICVKELLKLSEAPEMVQATVPKGSTVVPCAYGYPNGIWAGEPVKTGS